MPIRVVDASALGALVFGEPKAERVAELLSDGSIVAPALVWFELASICLKKLKAHPKQTKVIFEVFDYASRLAIEIVEVDHSSVIELASDKGITTYDASYVWLAHQLRAELITLDEKMRKAVSS
jgi:predicted nucleic acid-binding protein